MTVVLWALLGILAAVPLNHLADRLPRHRKPFVWPACPQCGHHYRPQQTLALLAVITHDGTCRHCRAALPLGRWLFEVGLAILYAFLAARFGLSARLLVATIHASILALITLTDIEQRVVPNTVVVPAVLFTLLVGGLNRPQALPAILLGGAIGFFLFLLLAVVYPGAMGFGDVKLAGYVGLIAAYPHVLTCLLTAMLAGGVAAGVYLLSGRGTRKSFIPYAPFLALGGLLAVFML